MSVTCLVGGQFGSEGKGLVAGHIAKDYGVHVRVGAANAGHTVYTHDQDEPYVWEKHVLQQIPCAAYANPEATLAIGPGALISEDILRREVAQLHQWRAARGLSWQPILIDPRAHVIQPKQIERETKSGLAERIGSTSTIAREGVGTAQADRVMRQPWCVTARDWHCTSDWAPARFYLTDVPRFLAAGAHQSILLEGTQGTGLSLTTGNFPYVTSRNTTAAGLCADVGIGPKEVDRVILVCRTYPIRVAGNSGPFYSDSWETHWAEIGNGIDEEKERTTVTKKVRRVATFSLRQAVDAAALNGATEIALTFADYLSPRLYGVTDLNEMDSDADAKVLDLVGQLWELTGLPVTMLGTGPHSIIDAPGGLLT